MTELPGSQPVTSPLPPMPGSGPQSPVTPDKIPGFNWVVQKWIRFLYHAGFTSAPVDFIWHAANGYAAKEITAAGMVIKPEMFLLAGETAPPQHFLPGVTQK